MKDLSRTLTSTDVVTTLDESWSTLDHRSDSTRGLRSVSPPPLDLRVFSNRVPNHHPLHPFTPPPFVTTRYFSKTFPIS